MQIAKATQQDLDTAIKLTQAVENLTDAWSPTLPGTHQQFDIRDIRDCAHALRGLLAASPATSLARVVYGMVVLLDPANKMVNPDATNLEHHPERFVKTDNNEATRQPLKTDGLAALLGDDQEKSALKSRVRDLSERVAHLESLRPLWAKGFTSDAMAATAFAGNVAAVHRLLGTSDHTSTMKVLRELTAQAGYAPMPKPKPKPAAHPFSAMPPGDDAGPSMSKGETNGLSGKPA